MQAGRLNKRVTFRRREKRPGGGRGDYQDLFPAFAEFRPLSARALAEAGSVTDGIEANLVVRDTGRTRGLTNGDRVVVDGQDFMIESVPLGDRSGWLWLKVSRRKAAN